MKGSNFSKNEVFRQVFESHYQGKEQGKFSQLVKNFAGRSKDAGLRKQVYMIYEFYNLQAILRLG